ncbi:unnamed protein product [Lymnaea stagnalis]|uniref:ShKT domain-containing protein n=1 Tax=Lymnaea stagnalis TaxID=6523 RepID=A0AAV2IHX1_LYMST
MDSSPWIRLVLLLLLLEPEPTTGKKKDYDCRDLEMTCSILHATFDDFCSDPLHEDYVRDHCQKTCGFCIPKPEFFEHGSNLIWAQSPYVKVYTLSRLVSIQGDPVTWAASRKPQVTYISAPHYSWEFKALAFHWEDQTLFWSESTNKKIQCLVLNGSTDTLTLFSGTSTEVYGLAVDWLSRNIYFTDALYNWIVMASTDTNSNAYKIIVNDQLDAPHGIAVHPRKGLLFWSDWGERPKIEVADLLGQNRKTLVERDIVKPRGLTVDYDKDLIYWVDADKSTLEVMQLSGQGRKVIHREEGTNFYGVALYGDFLFVTEKSRGMLKVFNKQQTMVSFTLGNKPYDIIMYDGSQQMGNSSDCETMACEQLCVFDPVSGPKCLCGEGYLPDDEGSISCKPSQKLVHPSHIYAIRDSICQYPANLADMSLLNISLDSQCFLEDRQVMMCNVSHGQAMMCNNMLYYFANNTKTISRIPLELGGKGKGVTGGSGEVKGMALDWVSGNLYWTDCTSRAIRVSKKTGAHQKVLLEKLNNPVAIAVHPARGEIYWTDHGHLPDIGGKVEKANMDGTGRKVILDRNIGQPNHLYVDYQKDCLYWADSILYHVRKYDLKSGTITVAFEQPNVKFYGISFFQDYLIWTDTEDLNGIHIARMDRKEKIRGIIHPKNGIAADLITFDIKNQPEMNNSCSEGSHRCSQLCLTSEGNKGTCACGSGYEISVIDGFTCNTEPVFDNFLLMNDAYQKQIFQMSLVTAVVGAVNLFPTHEPVALAYDPYEFRVYWSDNKQNIVKQATMDGHNEKIVLYLNNGSMCDGLAADYLNKLLFFTDTGNDVIGVVSMRNYDFYTYIISSNLDEPRDIVVSPNLGLIYWSDWGLNAMIERSNMDGTDRQTIVNFTGIAWPNGLALDLSENKLYWVDAHMDSVSVIDLATNAITKLIEEPGAHYFSMDVIGPYLYVTDWKRNYLRRMSKKGGSLDQFGPAIFTRLYGIKGFNTSEAFKGVSVCVYSSCEQLCLPKLHNRYECRCSVGYVANGQSCVRESNMTTASNTTPTATEPTAPTATDSTPTEPTTATTSQSTDTPTSDESITKLPVTMTTDFGGESDPTDFGITIDITTYSGNVTVTQAVNTSQVNVSVGEVTQKSSKGIPVAVIVVIVCCIVLAVIIIVLSAVFISRRYRYKIRHGKLIEEKNPSDFYKIAFPSPGEDNVTFDTGTGIENPIYDCLNDPTSNLT